MTRPRLSPTRTTESVQTDRVKSHPTRSSQSRSYPTSTASSAKTDLAVLVRPDNCKPKMEHALRRLPRKQSLRHPVQKQCLIRLAHQAKSGMALSARPLALSPV